MKVRDRITKARAGLVLDQPFFGSLALRLGVVEDSGCETAWTDGQTLGFNPGFIDGLSLDETKGLLAHEVMHLAAAHQSRRGGRDAGRWNMACDYAINGLLEESGFWLPAGRLRDKRFDGLSADVIYAQLPDAPGNSAGGDPGGCGEVRDASVDVGEAGGSEQDWKVAVAQAAQQARAMGKLPAGVARMVEEMLQPKVEWREVLRRFVRTAAWNDYQWTPPNRRFVHLGLYLPSLRSEELSEIVVAVDTSGSIDGSMLDQFAGELSGILEDFETTIFVLYADAAVAGCETLTREDLPLRLHPAGGGGTDFRPAFRWVEEQGKTPACLVYLTDLDGAFPEEEPSYPVLWARIGGEGEEPPFGEVLEVA
jgi:predicted metal-dependent peptidase